MHFCFLICSERSGSNLITRILDSHPDITGPSPTHMFRILIKNIQKYGTLEKEKNWRGLLRDVVSLFNTKFGVWNIHITIKELSEKVKKRSLGEVLRYIYSKEAGYLGKNILFVKENQTYELAPFILSAFKNPSFLYLVRDPRDMALSWKMSDRHRTLEMPGGVRDGARVWQEDQQNSIRLFNQLAGQGMTEILKYEDLLENPKNEVKRICSFLKVNYSETMLDFYKNKMTKANAHRVKMWKNLEKPLMIKNYNKFLKQLSSEEIQWVENHCQKEMNVLGYGFTRHPVTDLAELNRKLDILEAPLVNLKAKLLADEQKRRKKRRDVLMEIENKIGPQLAST